MKKTRRKTKRKRSRKCVFLTFENDLNVLGKFGGLTVVGCVLWNHVTGPPFVTGEGIEIMARIQGVVDAQGQIAG